MRRKSVFAFLGLLLGGSVLFGQSAGSGAGAFANAYLIPTIVCQAGTFQTGTATTCTNNGGGPAVLFADIKVPSASNKDVLLMASLESGILTNTQVSSKNGQQSTATAMGSVVVTPHVFACPNNNCTVLTAADECTSNIATSPCAVFPNHVTFNERQQTLTANLLGLGCTADLLTGIITCTDPETIGLILSTTSANSFNFLVHNLSSGVYQIQLQVGLTTVATTNSLQAGAQAEVAVGAGSLVNMIVQAQTPFNTITLCGSHPNTGSGANSCGP